MIFEEDVRRLLEARCDVNAARNPEAVASTEAEKAHLAQSGDALAARREALRQAATTQQRERGETEEEISKHTATRRDAVALYSFVRPKVQDLLLNPDPDQPVRPEEVKRRQQLFDRYFGIPPSAFQDMAAGDLVERLKSVADAMSTDKELAPLGLGQRMMDSWRSLDERRAELEREEKEDTDAMRAVRRARQPLDREAKAHSLLVQSILTRAGRIDELGKVIKAKDPAYAARRKAGVPIQKDPDVKAEDSGATDDRGGGEAPQPVEPVAPVAPVEPVEPTE